MDIIGKIKSTSSPFYDRLSHKVYGSFHFPELTITDTFRNTLDRFNEFAVESNLYGKTVIDLGCNLCELGFEAARRSAKSVIGYEINPAKVQTAKEIADFTGFGNVDVIAFDVDNGQIKDSADIVFCCALDAHVKNRPKLYDLLHDLTKEVCYFETNRKEAEIPTEDFYHFFCEWPTVVYLGKTKDNAEHERRMFYLSKKESYKYRVSGSKFDHFMFKTGNELKRIFLNENTYLQCRKVYELVKSLPGVPKIDYSNYKQEIRQFSGECLYDMKLTPREIKKYRSQFINFLNEIHSLNVAHADLHTKNMIIDNGQLYVIDWESAVICQSKAEAERIDYYEKCDYNHEGTPLTFRHSDSKLNVSDVLQINVSEL